MRLVESGFTRVVSMNSLRNVLLFAAATVLAGGTLAQAPAAPPPMPANIAPPPIPAAGDPPASPRDGKIDTRNWA